MNVTQTPEVVHWPETNYVFLQKTGPFQITAPKAWAMLHEVLDGIKQHNEVTGYLAQYKYCPSEMIYRAGVRIKGAAKNLPDGLLYEKFKGGSYAKFVLTGSWSNLPTASGRVFEIIQETKMARRKDFNIEHYVNDPKTTAEKDLITEILIPIP